MWFSIRLLTISSMKNGLPPVRCSRNVTSSFGTLLASRSDSDQFPRVAVRELRQADLADAALVEGELRAVVVQRQRRCQLLGRELPQEVDCRRVGPVQVLQADDERSARRECEDERPQRFQQASAVCLAVDRGALRAFDIVELEQGRKYLGRILDDRGNAQLELRAHGRGGIRFVDADAVADEVRDRVVRNVLRERVGAALHPCCVGRDSSAELLERDGSSPTPPRPTRRRMPVYRCAHARTRPEAGSARCPVRRSGPDAVRASRSREAMETTRATATGSPLPFRSCRPEVFEVECRLNGAAGLRADEHLPGLRPATAAGPRR